MTVTIAVPLGRNEPWRDRAWAYTRAWWQRETGWPIVTGRHDGERYQKGLALADALEHVTTPYTLVLDADILIPDLPAVAEQTVAAGVWAQPHRNIIRLTQAATEAVYAGADPFQAAQDRRQRLERYRHVVGGGALLLPTAWARQVPFDPRFRGWGGADHSWGWALHTTFGPPRLFENPALHLWHPPQPRQSRERGNPENEALKARYSRAFGNRAAMSELTAEARAALRRERQRQAA